MDQLWQQVLLLSASFIDTDEPIRIQVDDGTYKKNGRQIEGASNYRDGAGSAWQEYRSLCGLNWVWATMTIPFKRWPGYGLSIPVGLKLYVKQDIAKDLKVNYKSRSQLDCRLNRKYLNQSPYHGKCRWGLFNQAIFTQPP